MLAWPWPLLFFFSLCNSGEITDSLLSISLSLYWELPKRLSSAETPILNSTPIFLTAPWPSPSGWIIGASKSVYFQNCIILLSKTISLPSVFPILLKDTLIPPSVQVRSSLLFSLVQISWVNQFSGHEIYLLTFNSIALSIHGPCLNWCPHQLWSRGLNIQLRFSALPLSFHSMWELSF